MIIRADKFNWIPDFPYKMEVITSLAIILIFASFYNYYHKLCPMSRWSRSSWATGMMAAVWSVIPPILYVTKINDNWEQMLNYTLWSSVMWIAFLFCLYKLWRVRKFVRAEIAMIEWRSRNKRNRR